MQYSISCIISLTTCRPPKARSETHKLWAEICIHHTLDTFIGYWRVKPFWHFLLLNPMKRHIFLVLLFLMVWKGLSCEGKLFTNNFNSWFYICHKKRDSSCRFSTQFRYQDFYIAIIISQCSITLGWCKRNYLGVRRLRMKSKNLMLKNMVLVWIQRSKVSWKSTPA